MFVRTISHASKLRKTLKVWKMLICLSSVWILSYDDPKALNAMVGPTGGSSEPTGRLFILPRSQLSTCLLSLSTLLRDSPSFAQNCHAWQPNVGIPASRGLQHEKVHAQIHLQSLPIMFANHASCWQQLSQHHPYLIQHLPNNPSMFHWTGSHIPSAIHRTVKS